MHWKHTAYDAALHHQVPDGPGVYAVVRVRRALGLPVSWHVHYVGKSLDLRRRFREHARLWSEGNLGLRETAERQRGSLEYWCRQVPAQDLDRAERELIRVANPTENVIKYKVNV